VRTAARAGVAAVRRVFYGLRMTVDDLHQDEDQPAPWLVDLAFPQEDSGPQPGTPTYDDARQMTYLQEPVQEPAIDSARGVMTKKADRETGEDEKGF
jgi:hypothetical protein